MDVDGYLRAGWEVEGGRDGTGGRTVSKSVSIYSSVESLAASICSCSRRCLDGSLVISAPSPRVSGRLSAHRKSGAVRARTVTSAISEDDGRFLMTKLRYEAQERGQK